MGQTPLEGLSLGLAWKGRRVRVRVGGSFIASAFSARASETLAPGLELEGVTWGPPNPSKLGRKHPLRGSLESDEGPGRPGLEPGPGHCWFAVCPSSLLLLQSRVCLGDAGPSSGPCWLQQL